jgi:hypothetical protein
MSEACWLSQTDAQSMLKVAVDRWSCWHCHYGWEHYLRPEPDPCPACSGSPHNRRLTPRKLRLLACAFCRVAWDELTGDPARNAVEELVRARERSTAPAARVAAGKNSLGAAAGALDQVLARLKTLHEGELSGALHAELARVYSNVVVECGRLGRGTVKRVAKLREQRFRDDYSDRLNHALMADRRRLCAVLYDILGNPFAPVSIKPEWLEADGGRVRQVAGGIYADRDFEAMPVLADALQDAGCQDARLLDHCLQDGHYRGCWLLDAILGKR